MKAEIINVGTELLLGGIVNTNSRYLSEELAAIGIGVYYQTSVGDNPSRLKKVLASAVSRSNVIIITGGLGPTADDITKETVSAALNIPLVEDAASLEKIEKYFAASGRKMPEANKKQALCPKGAVIFANPVGTAPGYALSAGRQYILMLPGPPHELKTMFETSVRDYLSKITDSGVILSKEVRIFGMGESEVAEKVEDLLNNSNPTVAPYAKNGEVELRVTAKSENVLVANRMCMEVVEEICSRLGNVVYTTEHKNLQETVVAMLKEAGLGLSTAESCTAGLLSSRITEVPGASQVFNFGIVAYANDIKQNILGVKPETLEQFGAVSRQTALEMAAGAREKGNTKLGVAITGVAGPGASESKPVGLVYVALCDEKQYWCRELNLNHKAGDRDAIRNLSAMNALDMARIYLAEYPNPQGGTAYDLNPKEAEPAKEDAQLLMNETFNAGALTSQNVIDQQYVLVVEDNAEAPERLAENMGADYNFVGVVADDDEEFAPRKKRFGFFGRKKSDEAVAQKAETFEENASADDVLEETDSANDIPLNEEILLNDAEIAEEIAADLAENEAEEETVEESAPEAEEQAEEVVSEAVAEVEEPEEETAEEAVSLFEDEPLDEDDEKEDLIEDENGIIVLSEEEEDKKPMEKKGNLFKRIVKSIIPWKGDKIGEIIRKICFLVSLAVFVFALIYLVSFFSDQTTNNRLINNAREDMAQQETDNTVNEDGVYNRFQFLLQQNPDTIGWIKIDDTNVNNPVYQCEDITYYENHNMAGEESRYGALFVHPDAYIDADTTARNITIYGHNTQDGSMFGNLTKYRLSGFAKRHPIIHFDSIYREGDYKIFAAMIVNAYPGQDDGYAYNYSRTAFSSDLDFEMWIDEARKRSMYNTGIDVTAEDEILTLSTCVYDFYEARLVIMARRVREGESLKVDTKLFKDNGKATLYPQAYYEQYGGTKPNYYDR